MNCCGDQIQEKHSQLATRRGSGGRGGNGGGERGRGGGEVGREGGEGSRPEAMDVDEDDNNNNDDVDSPTTKGLREIAINLATRRAQSVGDLVQRTLSQHELTQLGQNYAARRDVLRELFTLLSLESLEGVEMSVLR